MPYDPSHDDIPRDYQYATTTPAERIQPGDIIEVGPRFWPYAPRALAVVIGGRTLYASGDLRFSVRHLTAQRHALVTYRPDAPVRLWRRQDGSAA